MYKPEKELPDEIKSLPREETKCKFCGVSYLVHHEVKKLECDLERVQSELIKYHDEKEQLKEIPNLHSKLKELRTEVDEWAHVYRVSKQQTFSSLHKIKESIQQWRSVYDNLKQLMVSMAIGQLDKHKEISQAAVRVSGSLRKSRKLENTLNLRIRELRTELDLVNSRALSETEKLKQLLEGERLIISKQEAELSDIKNRMKLRQDHQKKLELENKELLLDKKNLLARIKEDNVRWTQKLNGITGNHTDEVSALQRDILEKEKEISALQCQLEENDKEHTLESSMLNQNVLNLKSKCEARLTQHKAELDKLKKQSVIHTSEAIVSLKKQTTSDFLKEKEEIKRHNAEAIEKIKSECQQQIKQMKSELSDSRSLFEEKIAKLQQQLQHEKDVNQTDVLRHISEEKELATQLHHTTSMLEARNKEHEDIITKMRLMDTENIQIKKQCEKLTVEKEKVHSKLEKAYNEISSLQKTVEQQCSERAELMTRIHQTK